MDIKLKYKTWVNEKHRNISIPLTNSDIETFAIEFSQWLVDNYFTLDNKAESEDMCQWHDWIKHPSHPIIGAMICRNCRAELA